MIAKRLINYARTYRHLRIDWKTSALYLALFTLPMVILLLVFSGVITGWVCDIAEHFLRGALPDVEIGREVIYFTPFSKVAYLTLPTTLPKTGFVLANLAVSLLVTIACSAFKWKGEPLPIFIVLNGLYFTINCLFFLFADYAFPYTATDYSMLYMSEEIGIWFTFIVLSGLVTAFVGSHGLKHKLAACLAIYAYSFVFGVARYAFFLFILQRFSVLYMAVMFFTVGPLFDFLYFVLVYAFFVNRMIRFYDSGSERSEWTW